MDFALSPEQELLRRSARELLATEWGIEQARALADGPHEGAAAVWRQMVELDWLALPFPSAYGGADASLVDLIVLLEELGRAHAPSLFRTAVLAGLTVLEAGTQAQKSDWLPRIAAGELVMTLAIHNVSRPTASGGPLHIDRAGGTCVLNGTALFVTDAQSAEYIICAAEDADARPAGVTLCAVCADGGTAPGVRLTPLSTMSGDRHSAVCFDNTPVRSEHVLGATGGAATPLERVNQIGAVATCAELLGGARRVLELAVAQGNNRIQFGRPIGSFQAVQHHCANMLMDVELGRFLTYQAAWLLSQRLPCRQQVSMAKAFVSDAYGRVVALGHEVLGGNGLIEEHEMPLFSKRALAGQQLFGSPDQHREVVAQELGLNSSETGSNGLVHTQDVVKTAL